MKMQINGYAIVYEVLMNEAESAMSCLCMGEGFPNMAQLYAMGKHCIHWRSVVFG